MGECVPEPTSSTLFRPVRFYTRPAPLRFSPGSSASRSHGNVQDDDVYSIDNPLVQGGTQLVFVGTSTGSGGYPDPLGPLDLTGTPSPGTLGSAKLTYQPSPQSFAIFVFSSAMLALSS